MPDSRFKRFRGVSLTTAIVLVLTTAVSTVVIAAHTFPDDVPDDNTFHEDIEWLAANDVTRGCNPPDNTAFCPDDPVTREQMSAFMRRFAGTFFTIGDQVTDDSSPITVDSTTLVEVATVTVPTEADARVSFDGHATIESEAGAEGHFNVVIARDSCEGTVVGSGTSQVTLSDTVPITTLSITGFDTIADATEEREMTDYFLCAAKGADTAANGTALQRGLTANAVPNESVPSP